MSGSKINNDKLNESIDTMLQGAKDKKRKFVETVDLQVNLKNYDVQKDKRFSGTHRLPNVARPNMVVGIIVDAADQDRANALGLPSLTVEDLKKLNKNKKLIKKLCHQYRAFVSSQSLITQIPRIVGPQLNRAGRFPAGFGPKDDILAKVDDVKATVKFQLKKVLCLGAAVGSAEQSKDQLAVNISTAINFLVSLLKKRWQNVKSVYIKTTMGKPNRIY